MNVGSLRNARWKVILFLFILLVIFLLFYHRPTQRHISNFAYSIKRITHRSDPSKSQQKSIGTAARASSKVPIAILNLSMTVNGKYLRAELRTKRGNTPIFVYEQKSDVWVSGAILAHGIWEGGIVNAWQSFLERVPNATAVDIGANIGQYGLAALLMNRRAVFVEPVLQTALRIVKSIQVGKPDFQKRAIVIRNAVSDSRRRIVFRTAKGNVGGTGILDLKDSRLSNQGYGSAYTILLDDLVGVVPGRDVVMKMDIECSEKQALNKSDRFFSHYRVHAIIMEWTCSANSDQTPQFIKDMTRRGFRAFKIAAQPTTPLDPLKARKGWPGDIVWVNTRMKTIIPSG